MKIQTAIESFLSGKRVACGKFLSHEFVEDKNSRSGEYYGMLSRYQVLTSGGKVYAAQVRLPKTIQTHDDASRLIKVDLKVMDDVCVMDFSEEKNVYQAVNGTLWRASAVERLEK